MATPREASPINPGIDLNLLRVFCAIWDLRSLTAAGDRLGLTQPAISHALRRLRDRVGDPLFVRSTNRMLPTDAAIRLHEPFDRALTIIARAMQERTAFDPMTTERSFRIAMSDVAEVFALPRLMTTLARIAPNARVDVTPLQPVASVNALRSGEIDLAIGHLRDTDEGCVSRDAFNDRLVCMVRSTHPLAKGRLTRKNFGELRFFYARMTGPIHQMVEQWLIESEARPRIAGRGHFTVAADIVRATDLAAIFPEAVARGLGRPRDFRLLSLPFDLPPIEVKVVSHSRFAADMGITWLRDVVVDVLRQTAATGATTRQRRPSGAGTRRANARSQ